MAQKKRHSGLSITGYSLKSNIRFYLFGNVFHPEENDTKIIDFANVELLLCSFSWNIVISKIGSFQANIDKLLNYWVWETVFNEP